MGFNLEECGELVNLFNDPARHSADVKARTLQKVAEIERHIVELEAMRKQLMSLAESCPAMTEPTARLLITFPAAAITRHTLRVEHKDHRAAIPWRGGEALFLLRIPDAVLHASDFKRNA